MNRLSAATCVLSHQGSSPQIRTAPPSGCAPANVPSASASDATCTPTLFIDGRINLLPLRSEYLVFTIDDELQWQKEKGWTFAAAPQGRTPGR